MRPLPRQAGARPDVDTQRPDLRLLLHLTSTPCTLYVDTCGEPLFKRGWREDKGEAPLKETLAAAMLAAAGWQADVRGGLHDPCCGAGTIAIEAAQIACGIAPGLAALRLRAPAAVPAAACLAAAEGRGAGAQHAPAVPIFGSDVSFRMVDFARRNAERAGVAAGASSSAAAMRCSGLPPCEAPGTMMLNPPYGERIETAGGPGGSSAARERPQVARRRRTSSPRWRRTGSGTTPAGPPGC